jgi:signal transduction histidine kinase
MGIKPEMLEQFRSAGVFGVGLAGIRERVRELGGTFDINSTGTGTALRVTIPGQNTADLAAQPGEALRKGSSPGL